MLDSWRSSTESAAQTAIPVAGTLSKLHITLDGNAGAAASNRSYTFTIRKNGVNTAVTCVVFEVASSCSDTTNSVAFAEGDLITLMSVPSATNPIVRGLHWTAKFSAQ